ncbi:ABC transporter permease [Streptomyces sp. PRh5]|uniref:ABC transporter permease n=1 Tax=Streptomyces sp. PRh5 TaxID=1158056 RepID=UPI0004532C2E|nr:ABC transporter permease [Streptomyces sp. PRh5]EXU68135.1 ABC transporter permease [Streptomyces sp. PRh5]
MNFVKRAAHSLLARKGKSAILLGIFVVVCTLLLGGFLLQGATARQEAEAQRRIGVDVTVRGTRLTTGPAAKLGASPLVERYNPVLRGVPRAPGLKLVEPGAPRPPGAKDGAAGPGLAGVRETDMLLDFATGRTKVIAGRAITAADADHEVVMVEERAAEKNRLAAGDRVTLASPDGGTKKSFEVVGVFQDPAEVPDTWLPPAEIPANQLYAPIGSLRGLGLGEHLAEAVYKIRSPERARALHTDAARLLGAGEGFRFDVNDKAYRDQVQPLRRVGAFAEAVVWLIAVAGAVILGLIVTLTIRERRDELGTLLALGEKKWKLVGQHTVEVAAVAVPALACAALAAGLFGGQLGDRLPAQEATDRPTAHAPRTEPLPHAEVRLTPGDLGKVAGTSLGIALVATVIPGIGILRLHPRSILTDGD